MGRRERRKTKKRGKEIDDDGFENRGILDSFVREFAMDVSSVSTTTLRASYPIESLLLKRVKLPSWNHSFVPVSWSNRTSQTFFGKTGSLVLNNSSSSLKVLCSQQREIPVVEARCMDDIYDALAERLIATSAITYNPNVKHIVGLAGPPGAGKSTLASEVVRRVNKIWTQESSSYDSQVKPLDVATVLPMDGFHLYRSQLDAMENPEEAHARRGAPWTFDPLLLLNCLKNLKSQGSVYAPSFDHGVGDPVEDDIFVSLQHKVVIVEGNYLFLNEGIWKDVSSMFNEKWFIEVDLDTAMQRVLKRHISTGKPPDVAKWRIEYNDRPNAELIIKSKKNADLLIRSVEW